MSEALPNASIAGAGSIGGGSYDVVKCSGSAKIEGDLSCTRFSCAGATKVRGSLTCRETVKLSGAFKAEGSLTSHTVKAAGAISTEGTLQASEVNISGALRVKEDCSAETITVRGGIIVGGLLNAETVVIELERNNRKSEIGSIGGGTVSVSAVSRGFFRKSAPRLTCGLIEADSVDLEHTHAETVRATDAVIRRGCRIGTLEYSGTLKTEDGAEIGETVKR